MNEQPEGLMGVSTDMLAYERSLGAHTGRLKRAVLDLLAEDERFTTRDIHGTGEPVSNWEDNARRIARDGTDGRSRPMAIALREYEQHVNKMWLHALERKYDRQLAYIWHTSRRKKHKGRISQSEASAEVLFRLRDWIVAWEPLPDSDLMVGLMDYCVVPSNRALDLWYTRLLSPVRVPEKEARAQFGRTLSAPLEELDPINNEEEED